MYNSEEEQKITDIFYWENKMKVVEEGMTLFNSKIKNKKSKQIKKQYDYKVFEYAPKEILLNEDLMLKAINDGFTYFFLLPEELQNNKDFNIRYLKEVNYSYYYSISSKMLENEEVMIAAIQKHAEAFSKINDYYNLRNIYLNEEKVLEFLDINPKIVQFLDKDWKSNENVARKAIDLDMENVKYLTKKTCRKIFDEITIVDKLLSLKVNLMGTDNFEKINLKFFKDKNFLIKYLPNAPQIIKFAPEKLKHDMDILKLAAPAWNFLDEVDDKYKKDVGLMSKHLEHNPFYYEKVSQFLDIKPIMVSLIKKQHYPYSYLNEEDKKDPDYIYAVLEHDAFYQKPEITNHSYYAPYERVSILKILPTEIQVELHKEATERYPDLNIMRATKQLSEEEAQKKILKHARDKYLDLYLRKHLNNLENNKKKLKL